MKHHIDNLIAVENPKLTEVEVETTPIEKKRCYHQRYFGFGICTKYVARCEDCGADIRHLLLSNR